MFTLILSRITLKTNSNTGQKRHTGDRDPRISLYKSTDGERRSLILAVKNVKSRPVYPSTSPCTSSGVHKLAVIQSRQSEIASPFYPSSRVNQPVEIRLEKHRSRVLLPRPPQVALKPAFNRLEVWCWPDP